MALFSNPLKPTRSERVDSVVVIGLGRFGSALATELEATGTDVLCIDKETATVQRMSATLRNVVRADATNEEVLRQLDIEDFSRVVVAIGDDLAASILTTSVLLKIGGPEVWAKASSPEQGKIFEQMGVRHIFYPEADMGKRAAHLVLQSFLDYVDLGYGFALVATEAGPMLSGRSLGELDVRRKDGITVIAVRGGDGSWRSAHADTVLDEDETILVVAPVRNVSKLQRLNP